MLTKVDVQQIKDYLGLDTHRFIQSECNGENSNSLTFIRTHTKGGCIFYKNNKCQIYNVRPLDCRLFPLDIFKLGNNFHWLIYDTFCHQPFDYEMLQNYGRKLIEDYKVNLEEFGRRMKIFPPLVTFKALGKINI